MQMETRNMKAIRHVSYDELFFVTDDTDFSVTHELFKNYI